MSSLSRSKTQIGPLKDTSTTLDHAFIRSFIKKVQKLNDNNQKTKEAD